MSILTDAITSFNAKLDNTIATIIGVNSTIDTRAAAVAADAGAASVSKSDAAASAVAAAGSAVAAQTSGSAIALTASLAASGGSALVGYLPIGTGAVASTVQGKQRESVSVKDFGAVGNGVTDDTAAIQAAVTAAIAAGKSIFWPYGNFITSNNITNFHSVAYEGPGIISTGGGTYVVNPEWSTNTTNTFYVSTTGASGNDGLAATRPFATIQQAFDALTNSGGSLGGNWVIQVAAGTYNAASSLSGIQFKNRLQILGPSVSGGVPLAIIDGTGLSLISLTGMSLSNNIFAYVKDIKFSNWNGGAGVGSGDASIGLDVRLDCNVWADNVDTSLCGTGIYATKSRLYQGGGRVSGCDQGSVAFGSTVATFGYGTATTYSTCPSAIICRDSSSGVIENGIFTGNTTSVKMIHGSILRVSNSTFTGSVTSDVYLYTGSSCFFGTGNTHTAGKKLRSQFAMSLDTSDQFYYDGDADKFNFGVLGTPGYKFQFRGLATGSFATSSALLAVEAASPQIALNGSAAGIFGFRCAVPGTSEISSIIYTDSDSNWRIRAGNVDSYRLAATSFRPVVDNTVSLGLVTNRWSVVYAGTATINTSDMREKQQIKMLSASEKNVAIKLKALIRSFKFNDAVKAKGDGARIHFGVMAQDVKAAFESEGLAAEAYALLCYDTWEEQQQELAEDGSIAQECVPAGNRYGVRYEELLAFIIGAL